MNINQWINTFAADAVEARDRERYHLVVFTGEALPLIGDDPDRALALLEEGRALAERLGEHWFVRFFEHWMIQALLFHKRNPQAALPLAEAAVEATQTGDYADFPQRICLREDLIFSYLSRDPHGYGPQIEAALDYMQTEIAPDCPCLHCLQEIRTAYPLALGRLGDAEQAALSAVKLAWPASDYHHVLIAFASLCQIAWQREDWPKLAHWSGSGKTFEGQGVGVAYVHALLLWQAVASRRRGADQEAAAQYRHIRGVMRGLASVPTAGYFDALFAYHEQDADLRPALAACRLELHGLRGSGEVARECEVLLRLRRLLARRGMPTEAEDAALQTLAASLADPQAILSQLTH